MAFLDKNTNKLEMKDINMATHISFFGRFIAKCGNIGSLQIYNDAQLSIHEIEICNNGSRTSYFINDDDIYKFINTSLNHFFKEHGMLTDKSSEITKVEEVKKEPAYVKPNKPMSEMTDEERAEFARNRFAREEPPKNL